MAVDGNALMLGKLLGEMYRMQSRTGIPCAASAERIYGLLNGFETEIENELESIGFVSQEQMRRVSDVISPIWDDPEKLANFKGFYDIERDLERVGIDRSAAIRIFTYFAAGNRFTDLLEKMNTSGSPSGCRRFEVPDWKK